MIFVTNFMQEEEQCAYCPCPSSSCLFIRPLIPILSLHPPNLSVCLNLNMIERCRVMSYHVMSCHIMSCHVMLCHVMSCHVMWYHVMSSHIMSCHVMSCHVMSCHVMSCHVMSCHVMSCHVMSCHVIWLLLWYWSYYDAPHVSTITPHTSVPLAL